MHFYSAPCLGSGQRSGGFTSCAGCRSASLRAAPAAVTDRVATKPVSGHVWKPEEALDALAEIGPPLRELGAEVASQGPSHWRGTGPDLALTVWARRLRGQRSPARMSATRW
jgi:hypothetical protein